MLQSVFNIENDCDQVKSILSSLKKDSHFSKTFEGTAKNGVLKGAYTNLALVNGMAIGYVKISGNYDLVKGNLNLILKPSLLFLLVMLLNFTLTFIVFYPGIVGRQLDFIAVACILIFNACRELCHKFFNSIGIMLKLEQVY
ncbi:MAG: hypothetical protein ACK476_13410 [Fluviicola sp.]